METGSAADTKISIQHDGKAVSKLTLHEDKKAELTAAGASSKAVQWQYYEATQKLWINIYGETADTCTLTYAKVFNMLDGNKQAKIRAVQKDGKTAIESNEVLVTVEKAETPEPKATMDSKAASAPKKMRAVAKAPVAQADGSGDVKKTHKIIIKYVFDNNEIAADSYTADIAEGQPFSADVDNPVVQGYLPYIENADNSERVVHLDYPSVDRDETITVFYKPTTVNYTVIHHKQNIENDEYTEAEREVRSGLTKSTVPDVAKKYDGFYSLIYERPEIAADGSTVVDVYYDRYYYLMTFELDGGYGVEPIYARYGTPVSVETPTKAGYSFNSWDKEIPKTVPAENMTFTAIWGPEDVKYTVVFWYENANDEDYSVAGSMTASGPAGTSVSSAKHKDSNFQNRDNAHFTYNNEKAETVTINGDGSSVLNVYFTRNTYTITFKGNNGDFATLSCNKTEHTHSNNCYTACTHTHDINCWENIDKNSGTTTKPSGMNIANPINGNVYSVSSGLFGLKTTYYLYLNGKWYNAKTFLGSSQQPYLDCNHKHTDACIGCGQEAHTHNNSCYQGGSTSMYQVTAKYDADISYVWETAPVKPLLDQGYVFQSSVTEKYYSFLEKMPAQDITMTATKWKGDQYTWYYYLEVLPGQDTTGLTTRTDNGKTYYLYHTTSIFGDGLSLTYNEDYFPITGFTQRDNKVPDFNWVQSGRYDGYYGAYLYYTRQQYSLTFNNYGAVDKTEPLYYQQSLKDKNYTPGYPETLEKGAYYFEGWYSNQFFTEDGKVNFNTATMPAGPMVLYAHWVPYDHTVDTYLTLDAMKNDNPLNDQQIIEHRKFAQAPEDSLVKNGSYVFIGWFYQENGEEKAFNFNNTPITKDLKVYGKWSSNTLKEYKIYYKIQGEETEIAKPTTGSALAGLTKTFDAKGNTDLYSGYQEGFFPLIKSHSLTLDIENDEANTYTFYYVQKDAVSYTVKYLDAETGEPLKDEKIVEDNRKAVVTETFEPISGRMPDAYQKQLIVDGSDGAKNEIIFYYSKDTTHAYYKVTHYTQNTDGQTWRKYNSSQAIGDIGATYTAQPLSIKGFTLDKTVDGTVESGQLSDQGLALKLYYKRNKYSYKVNYLEYNSKEQLAESKIGEKTYFGKIVSEEAKPLDDYECMTDSPQTLNIKIEDTIKDNVINFYYKEKEVTINYVPVGPEGAGTVSPSEEILKVKTGVAKGSTAKANENYRFVGWYKDEKCTKSITNDSNYVPTKVNDKNVAATYYAKFEYDLADLTITKSGVNTELDENQTFMFRIVGDETDDRTKDIDLTVAIVGNGSQVIKDLPIGAYTVTEITDWSWRYKPTHKEQTITLKPNEPNEPNELTFVNNRSAELWLDGNAYRENVFK